LEADAAQYANPHEVISEGLALLEVHCSNYGPQGPQQLVVLWWECPPVHWEELRLGASMNFLATPAARKEPNSPFTIEQLSTTEGFVDELIALRVLDAVPEGTSLLSTCPLFLVPKPGQPVQWRCIADMKKGGQNAVCTSDPVYLPPLIHRGLC
jgi:hypothetical protein